jgi:predicted  nucleic acid-binding Zn-ribbon protein
MMKHPEEGGAWNPDMYPKYLPEEIAFDEGLIRLILDLLKPQKSLDMGCGQGFYVRYLRDRKVDAWGVEKEDLGELYKSPGHLIQQDLSQPFELDEKYDLVLCLEVVEHISREYENVVFDNILRHMSKYLVFSGATPGQQGTGHVNERPENHWFSHLVQRGLVLLHEESIKLRMACTLPWYAKNISIWELVHPDSYDLLNFVAEKYSQILACQLELDNMREQSNGLSGELSKAKSELEQMRSQFGDARTELAQMRSQHHEAQSELSKAKGELRQMRSQFGEAKTKLAQMQSQHHEAQTQLQDSQSQLQQIQIFFKELEPQLQNINENMEHFQNQIQQQANALVRSRDQLHQCRNELKQTHSKISAIEKTVLWKLRKVIFGTH